MYMWPWPWSQTLYVSKSDILDPNAYLSDIENLVSFERAMLEDYSFKYSSNENIPIIYVNITALK